MDSKLFRIVTSPLFALAAIFCVSVLAASSVGMGVDEGQWNYISRLWVEKHIPPYIGAVENKNPAIFFLLAISQKLFSLNIWFPRALGVISLSATAGIIYLITRELCDRIAGAFAMVVFGFTMLWNFLDGPYLAQTETFMVFFSTLSFFLLMRAFGKISLPGYIGLLFAAGLCMGIAVTFKQIALFTGAGLVFFYLFSRKRALLRTNAARDIFVILTGAVIAGALSILPLLKSGVGIKTYFDNVWLILLQVGYGSDRAVSFNNVWGRSTLKLFYPLILIFIFSRKKLATMNVPFWGIVAWMFFDFLGANATGFDWGHQFKEIVPSFSVVSGISLGLILTIFPESERARRTLQLLLVTALVWMPYESFRLLLKPPYEERKSDREIGLWIRQNTAPDDTVYIYGPCVGVAQAYSERLSPSRYFNSLFLTKPGAKDKLIADLARAKPRLILLPDYKGMKSGCMEETPTWLSKATQSSHRRTGVKYGYEIFERNLNQ